MKNTMRKPIFNSLKKPLMFAVLAGCSLSLAGVLQAQDDGYTIREDTKTENRLSNEVGKGKEESGPVRLARISYLSGDVTWRGDDSGEWSNANINLPLRQGAQIWVAKGGRAEVQFDDGTLLRLGSNSVATLQTLYSDSEGEFTEIKMTDGLAALRIKHNRSIYQIDTPIVSLKATGPAKLRVGVGDGVEVGVRQGKVKIEGEQGTATLQTGDYIDLQDSASAYDLRALPKGDNWERWNDDRDQNLESASESYRIHNLPENVAIAANDLDSYGTWRNDARYGNVWCPRVTSYSNWRPYHYGHWTYVNSFGWTWVSDEAWGWAPYHYGTWVNLSYGWSWVPGPVNQYWSPAVVSFSEYEGNISWCPLSPVEVRYPAIVSFGFHRRDWYSYFSIGQAACYYPTYGGYCSPVVYNTTVINRVTVNNYYNNNSRPQGAFGRYQLTAESDARRNNYANYDFVPQNSRYAAVTTASSGAFGGRGTFQAVSGNGSALFQRGRVISQPQNDGGRFVAGPASVRPTAQSFTPARTYTQSLVPVRSTRNVYQAPLAPTIARTTTPVNSTRTRGNEVRANDPGATTPRRTTQENNGNTRTQPTFGRTPRDNGGVSTSTGSANTRERTTETQTGNARTGSPAPIRRGGAPTTGQSAAQSARESLGTGGTTSNSNENPTKVFRRTNHGTSPDTSSPGSTRETAPTTERQRSETTTRQPDVRRETRPADTTRETARPAETRREARPAEPRTETRREARPAETRTETRQPEQRTETRRESRPEPTRETPPQTRQPEPRRESRPEPTRQADPPPSQSRGNGSDRTESSSNPTTSRGRRP